MNSIIQDIGMVVQAIRDTSVMPYANGAFTNGYDPNSIVPPFFYNGRRKEIVNKVTDLEKKNSTKVFPMIALNGDFEYVRRGSLVDYKLNLLIAVSTSADLSTEERETKNYVPTLYPLYEKFLYCFANIGLFMWDAKTDLQNVPHNPVNRYYYGTSDSDGNVKNMFNEPVDAIELVNLEFSRDVRDVVIPNVLGRHYEAQYVPQYE